MKTQELLKRIAPHKAELRRMGVVSLALFGSAARDEFHAQSDVDLLVDFDRSIGVFHFFRVQHLLEEILGVQKVDLVQRGALHPALRDRILAEAVDVR